MKKLTVKVNDEYNIFIEKGLLDASGRLAAEVVKGDKLVLVSDSNVHPLYAKRVRDSLEAAGFTVFEYVYPAGEKSKTTDTVIKIVEFMAQCGLTRSDAAVALGGGVCGDMTGFAAAVYMRGIDFIQIPTSLLAQVDSSVGGKTGVDLPQGKNLCGAFHQPGLVIIDSDVLKTLPAEFFCDGMGEVIKAGCIKSESLFARLENENPKDFIDDLIFQCLDIKRRVVENDEKEAGERALLNFGHTAGHAIEKLWNFNGITHGEAVGIGMVIAAGAGEDLGFTEKGTAERIKNVLEKNNLKLFDSHTMEEIVGAMSLDKKRTSRGIKLVLLRKIGDSFIYPVNNDDLSRIFGV